MFFCYVHIYWGKDFNCFPTVSMKVFFKWLKRISDTRYLRRWFIDYMRQVVEKKKKHPFSHTIHERILFLGALNGPGMTGTKVQASVPNGSHVVFKGAGSRTLKASRGPGCRINTLQVMALRQLNGFSIIASTHWSTKARESSFSFQEGSEHPLS